MLGPIITKDEILKALQNAKNKKATMSDDVPSEIIKLIDDQNIDVLHKIFNKVYDTGFFPSDWLLSTFIALPKKVNAKSCNDHRLISLMSHALKIFLKVLHNRMYPKAEIHMGKTQFGFKGGTGTREALFCVQVLVQNCCDVKKDVFLCFLDYEKAFDKVQHHKLMEILSTIDIDEKTIRCIKNLYWYQTANIKTSDGLTENILIKRGVRQGCILSPLLFNLYAEKIFQEALESVEIGIKVNGTFFNNIRYADDTTLLADNLSDLQHLIDKVNQHSINLGLKINVVKTKFMIISRCKTPYTTATVTVDHLPIERVSSYKYLGCWLNEQWTCEQEIRCRIEIARSAFIKYKKVFCCRDLNLDLRLRFLKCYVWSVLLYGVETWTLTTTHMNKLEAFEMWLYRRILKISWVDRVTNIEVLRSINKGRELLTDIKRRKISYFGHVMRGQKYELLQLIVQGKIEGKRGVGRKQMSWLRNIRNWTGISNIGDLVHIAMDRNEFRSILSRF